MTYFKPLADPWSGPTATSSYWRLKPNPFLCHTNVPMFKLVFIHCPLVSDSFLSFSGCDLISFYPPVGSQLYRQNCVQLFIMSATWCRYNADCFRYMLWMHPDLTTMCDVAAMPFVKRVRGVKGSEPPQPTRTSEILTGAPARLAAATYPGWRV